VYISGGHIIIWAFQKIDDTPLLNYLALAAWKLTIFVFRNVEFLFFNFFQISKKL
jgi:hypothetical protein